MSGCCTHTLTHTHLQQEVCMHRATLFSCRETETEKFQLLSPRSQPRTLLILLQRGAGKLFKLCVGCASTHKSKTKQKKISTETLELHKSAHGAYECCHLAFAVAFPIGQEKQQLRIKVTFWAQNMLRLT